MDAYVNRKDLNGGIAEITFFHSKSNAMPSDQLGKLAATIREAGEDDQINLVILKSDGEKAFCAGASFNELINIDDLETGKAFFSGFANVINAIRKCPKLVIGRVQGKAVGGGVGLAAAVDYCLATDAAAIRLSELNIGIGPFVIEPAVSRKVGLSNFTRLTLNPDQFFDAQWAKSSGLYAEIHPNIPSLDEAVAQLADKLATTNPVARHALKNALWKGTDDWDELLEERAALSGRMVLSDFTKKALEGFR